MVRDNLLRKFTGALTGCGICDSYVLPLKNFSRVEIRNMIVQQAVIEQDGGFAGLYSGENSPALSGLIKNIKDKDFKGENIQDLSVEIQYPFLLLIFLILPNFSRINNLEKIINSFFPDDRGKSDIFKVTAFILIKMLIGGFNTATIFDESVDYINDSELPEKIFLVKNLFSNNTKPSKALEKFAGFDTSFSVLSSALYSFMFSYPDFDSVLENVVLYSTERELTAPLAGAFFGATAGVEAFPEKYVKSLKTQKDIFSLAKKYHKIAVK